jgi:hypothetical protein
MPALIVSKRMVHKKGVWNPTPRVRNVASAQAQGSRHLFYALLDSRRLEVPANVEVRKCRKALLIDADPGMMTGEGLN